tara:strand:- start:155 stop:373 length:219 start_codon:yes stop_codon:yes gene_type:complete
MSDEEYIVDYERNLKVFKAMIELNDYKVKVLSFDDVDQEDEDRFTAIAEKISRYDVNKDQCWYFVLVESKEG